MSEPISSDDRLYDTDVPGVGENDLNHDKNVYKKFKQQL